MNTIHLHRAMPVAILFCLAASLPALATGDYSACNPGNYNADQCTRAHAKDGAVDLMDLAQHALAAGDKVAAFGAWSLAARSDKDPAAMYQLGAAYYNGEGAPQSDKAAAEWFKKSADLNYAAAQNMLGALYANGQGLAQNNSLAMTWYQKAADQNYPEALHNLGYFYFQGKSIAQDYERVAGLWRQAAETGYAPSYTTYGYLLYTGKGVEIDYEAAALWTRKGVAAGDPYAKSNLGEMYEYGRGVPRDIELAVKWYREAAAEGLQGAQEGLERVTSNALGSAWGNSPAIDRANDALMARDVDGFQRILTSEAEAGDFTAQVMLGFFYTGYGGGPVTDFDKAKAWMRKAVTQKAKAAAMDLDQQLIEVGVKLREGEMQGPNVNAAALLFDPAAKDFGEAKDYREAIEWFAMAAQLGNIDALIAIGDLYGEGKHGIDQDFAAALSNYERAAAKKATPLLAQRIGGHYAKGLGVTRNDKTAAQWFRKAVTEYPEAELWLAQYDLGQNNPRSAMYWLDRIYLRGALSKALADQHYRILRLYYETMLPPPPAGWTAKTEHQTTPKPIAPAHFSSSDIAYPITFQRRYKNAANGREYLVRVVLNDFAYAASTKKDIAEARRMAENARRKISSEKSAVLKEFHTNISEMHIRFGAFEAFSAGIKGDGVKDALIQIAINSHIVVRAETVNGDVGDAEQVETLKAALRATKLDLIKSAADGHGFYKKDINGKIYKP